MRKHWAVFDTDEGSEAPEMSIRSWHWTRRTAERSARRREAGYFDEPMSPYGRFGVRRLPDLSRSAPIQTPVHTDTLADILDP